MGVQGQLDPNEILKRPYHRIVVYGDDGISVSILEFPGCYECGDTVEEALSRLEETAEVWLEAVIELGQAIPEPVDLVKIQKIREITNGNQK